MANKAPPLHVLVARLTQQVSKLVKALSSCRCGHVHKNKSAWRGARKTPLKTPDLQKGTVKWFHVKAGYGFITLAVPAQTSFFIAQPSKG